MAVIVLPEQGQTRRGRLTAVRQVRQYLDKFKGKVRADVL
jgi:hypothetical protein